MRSCFTPPLLLSEAPNKISSKVISIAADAPRKNTCLAIIKVSTWILWVLSLQLQTTAAFKPSAVMFQVVDVNNAAL